MGTWGRAWTLEEVCAVMGHSSITVTQRYAHLAPDALHKAARSTGTDDVALPHAAPSRDVAIAESALKTGWAKRGSNPRPTPCKGEESSRSSEGLDDVGAALGHRAAEVLRRVAEGDAPGLAGEELVELVLSEPAVRLALEARDGGEFATRRLIELAALFVRSEPRSETAS